MSQNPPAPNGPNAAAVIEVRPSCVVFDLDGTLTASKVAIEPAMARTLLDVVRRIDVGIVTGGRFELIETQVLPFLDQLGWSHEDRTRLHLMPSCGTQRRRWDGTGWREDFRIDLDEGDRELAARVLLSVARELGLYENRQWGDLIDDRGGQVTYSVFGQRAPLAVKQAWDPDGSKKERIRVLAAQRLSHLSVSSGASSSIDVTSPGLDKAFGVEQLALSLGVPLNRVVYVGDRLQEGGNDASLLRLPDVARVQVLSPADTLAWAHELLSLLDPTGQGSAT